MILLLLLALGALTSADKLDRTYLPPPGSKFAGGSPDAILPPIEQPKEPEVSASTIRPIPGFEDIHLPNLEGIAPDLPNRPYSQRPIFGTRVTPGSTQAPVVSSYSEATSQPGFSSSYSTATSVTPYHPFTTPSGTTSYAFSQSTTYSPIEDGCIDSTCAYEQDGFVDSGIEPDISISHQAPDHYSQANQGSLHSGYQQGFPTQAPIRTQTSSRYPQNVPAQRTDNRGRPITYEPTFSTQAPIRQQTPGGVTSQYHSTARPILPSQHLGAQPPVQSYAQQGGPISKTPYQSSQYFDNQRPTQGINLKEGYEGTKAPTRYPGTTLIPQGASVNAPGQTQLSYDQQGRPIQPSQSPSKTPSHYTDNITHRPLIVHSFDQRGRPISPVPVTESTQYSRPPSPGQATSQNIGGSSLPPSENVDEYGRPVITSSGQPQLDDLHRPIQHVDDQGRPISRPSGTSSQYSGDISPSIDQQGRPIVPTQLDQQGHTISDIPSYQSSVSGPSTPNSRIPITSISPSDISRPNQGDRLRPEYHGINRNERPQADSDRNAVILEYKNIITPEGEFAYSYDTSNGIHADENGTSIDGVKAEGSYSYIGDDGKLYSIVYTADENGYQPYGDHLPTPPPIPEEILRVIEKVNLEKEAGIIDDGLYDENKYGYKKYQGMMDLMQPGGVYTEDDEYESDSGNFPTGPGDDGEITRNQHKQSSKVPQKSRPFKQSQQSKVRKQQTPTGSISQNKKSRPSESDAHVTSDADVPSDYEDEQDFFTDEDINNESTPTLPTQRPSFDRLQNKGRIPSRRPIGISKTGTRKPIKNYDQNFDDEYITDGDKATGNEKLPVDRNRERVNIKGKGRPRPDQNSFDSITKQKQDRTRLPYDSRIPQNKQRIPSKSRVDIVDQQVPSEDDDEYMDGLEESLTKDDEDVTVATVKQRRPLLMRGKMRQKINGNRPEEDNQEEYAEEEVSPDDVDDERTIQARPGQNQQGPTRNKPTNRDRIPQRKPAFDKINKRPTSRYPDVQVDDSDEYIDSEIEDEFDTIRHTIESSSRRPNLPTQSTQSSIRKGYDSSIQASTAKPTVIIQNEDKSRGYQYIPPRNMFVQDHVQGSIPISPKPGYTTTRPFTTPGFTQTTSFVDNGEVGQDSTTMPLGYFDSNRNISLPSRQHVHGISKPYGQRPGVHVTTTAAPSRRPDYTRPSQRPQGRPGTYSTGSTTTGTTRYPTTPDSKFPHIYESNDYQTSPDSEINEYVTGSDVSQSTPSNYNTGRPGRPGYSSTTNKPYYDSSDIAQSTSSDYTPNIPSQPGTRRRPSRPGYSPTTSKPYYTPTGSSAVYPSTGKPVYPGAQTSTLKPLPEYSSTDRNVYTGAKFGPGVTGAPESFTRYTPSGGSDISSTPGRPSGRPGSKVPGQKYPTDAPNLSGEEQLGINEGLAVDEYGRPISAQDRVKGEDFRGPKQPARFDPETGYHY